MQNYQFKYISHCLCITNPAYNRVERLMEVCFCQLLFKPEPLRAPYLEEMTLPKTASLIAKNHSLPQSFSPSLI